MKRSLAIGGLADGSLELARRARRLRARSGGLAPLLDGLGELPLLLGGQEGDQPDLVEVLAY